MAMQTGNTLTKYVQGYKIHKYTLDPVLLNSLVLCIIQFVSGKNWLLDPSIIVFIKAYQTEKRASFLKKGNVNSDSDTFQNR